jgi:2-succinyl-6-hydroxy-2,4-cyclohexadiene-1-carboxylate synthase
MTWGRGEPLVALHGFTQNAGCFAPFIPSIAGHTKRRRLVAIDLPGHGSSTNVRANLKESAALVADAGGEADYLGYSLGGRVLLHVALEHPEVTRKIVLIGAHAGIEDPAERAKRIESDELLANRLDAAVGDDKAFLAFLEDWLKGPLFTHLKPDRAMIWLRLINDPDAVASSLRLCGLGTQQPLWDRLGEISVPVLVLAGSYDERFTEIGRRICASIGDNARFEFVEKSGHSCHLEQPRKTAKIVEEFLKEGSR